MHRSEPQRGARLANSADQLIDDPPRWRPIVQLMPSLRMMPETDRPSWCSSAGR